MSGITEPPDTFERKEHETGFTAILRRLLSATPGAIGAALVDAEGEAVDYAGDRIDPFELKIAAAHWRIVLQEIEAGALGQRGGAARRLMVLTTKRLFMLDALPDGYALLSILKRNAALAHADRAVDAALHDLYVEAGWSAPPGLLRWYPIDVRLDGEGRPSAIGARGAWSDARVIARVAGGLQRGEVGFRVSVDRVEAEITIVRGRDDRWYGDLPIEALKGEATTV